MIQLPKGVKLACLSLDCPERFSVCCGAGSRGATKTQRKCGVPEFYCAKCGKEFIGGKCTAAERNNYMQVGRTIECGNCHPEKYPHCSDFPLPEKCGCICHDKPSNENWEGEITETAERITIDYANLSGRELVNRAEFRERVRVHLRSLLTTEIYKAVQKERKIWFDAEKTIKATERASIIRELKASQQCFNETHNAHKRKDGNG